MRRGRIHARTIALQCEVSLEHGLTPEDLATLGLRLDDLADPEATVAREQVYLHLERVRARGDFEQFVIALARRHTLSATGPVGMAAKATPTLREGLALYGRYQHLVNGLATVQITELGDVAVWTEHRHGPLDAAAALATEVNVLVTLAILEGFVPELRPLRVGLPREGDLSAYATFLEAPVEGGAPAGRFEFETRWLDAKNPGEDPEMVAYFSHLLERMDKTAQATPSVVTEVRQAALPRLASGPPSLAEVARALATSPRSLQRSLRIEGTSYATLLDALRHDVAAAYLGNPKLTVAEVAYLVGYADTRAFHRAYRRWTGKSPRSQVE